MSEPIPSTADVGGWTGQAETAAPPVVGCGTLRRLSELSGAGGPVLSVYLDLDQARYPSARMRDGRLWALMAGVQRGAGEANVRRAHEMLRSTAGVAFGARSLAMFSSAEGSRFATVPLPCHVESMAVVDTLAWLEPLAGMFTPGDSGVAILGPRCVRIFRGDPRVLIEFARVDCGPHGRATPSDRPGTRAEPPSAEHIAEHARRLSVLLMRAHRRRAFDHLVVAAASELRPSIEATLDSDLRERLAGPVELDLEHAPTEEVARAVAPVLLRAEDGKAADGKAEDGEAADGKAEDGEAADGVAADGVAAADGVTEPSRHSAIIPPSIRRQRITAPRRRSQGGGRVSVTRPAPSPGASLGGAPDRRETP